MRAEVVANPPSYPLTSLFGRGQGGYRPRTKHDPQMLNLVGL